MRQRVTPMLFFTVRGKAMTEILEQQEQDTAEFNDELSDEALDRTTDNGTPFCCAFCQH
jgi:hypothetical protein